MTAVEKTLAKMVGDKSEQYIAERRAADHLRGVIRAIELNVDGLNTKGYQQKLETQAALDRIKSLCREALK